MAEPLLKIRLHPELIAAAREFNRQVAAIDWDRFCRELLYVALTGRDLPAHSTAPESNADGSSPVSAATEATGGTTEAQEARDAH